MAPPPETPVFEWHPARFLQEQPRAPAHPHAVVVLNQPLVSLEPVRRVWSTARFRVAADGGANRLYDVRDEAGLSFHDLDAIIGDLDSLRPAVRRYFEQGSDAGAGAGAGAPATEVLHDGDQYSTDFGKAVRLVRQRHPGLDVVALGGLGGRVDQGLSQLHHLYLFDAGGPGPDGPGPDGPGPDGPGPDGPSPDGPSPEGRTLLLTSDSLAFLLRPGRHRIHVREEEPVAPSAGSGGPAEDVFAKHVGILPLQGPSVLTTRGLEWDVEDWPTSFGGQVSTSNHVLPDTRVVEVRTDQAVVFAIALKEAWQDK